MGVGAFLGAFTLAATSYKGIRIKRHFGAVITLSILVFITGFQRNYYVISGLLVLTGYCQTTALSSSNSTVQLNSPDNMRGRIMSVYALTNGISITVGNIYAGSMCERLGVSSAYKLNGIIGLIIIFALIAINYRPIMKRINESKASAVAV
jgi:MFS family permease